MYTFFGQKLKFSNLSVKEIYSYKPTVYETGVKASYGH